MNPLVAVLLITRHPEIIDATGIVVRDQWLSTLWEMAGLVIYVLGYALMARALIHLGGQYQLGGCVPQAKDKMVIDGPFRLVRHPMYAAALGISASLAGLTQSWALCGCLACIFSSFSC